MTEIGKKISYTAVITLFLCTFPLSQPQAQLATTATPDWAKALSLITDANDPLMQKFALWAYSTETSMPVDAKKLMAFVRANPGWPRTHVMEQQIEDDFPLSLRPYEIVEWFESHEPRGYKGIQLYISALLSLGRHSDARRELSRLWRDTPLQKNEVYALIGKYTKMFTPLDHARRMEHLIWNGRYSEAITMYAFVDQDTRQLAKARIALARDESGVDNYIQKVPAHLQNHAGLVYERLRWRRKRDMDDRAVDLLERQPDDLINPESWWQERHILLRRALEKGDHKEAYKIAQNHHLTEGADFAQAEWILGWLETNHLNQSTKAAPRFENMYNKVGSAISRSRAAYWAGLAHEKSGNKNAATEWYQLAGGYPATYYGQLAVEKLGLDYRPEKFPPYFPNRTERDVFENHELVRMIRILHKAGLDKMAEPFFARLLLDAKTPAQHRLIAELGAQTKQLQFSIQANKNLQMNHGGFLYQSGYPYMTRLPTDKPEKALVHAIIYRESMFNPNAISPAGARGLMQVMPATARELARRTGKNYALDALTGNPDFNIFLGSTYLQEMIERYNGSYPLAIAAYNAGPSRVNRWLETFGDPRTEEVDIVDWVEHLPIYETRNYVQRVMEAFYIYRLQFNQRGATIMAFNNFSKTQN